MWIKMGAELEGGWTRDTKKSIASKIRGAEAKGDSSVKYVQGEPGEITTPPYAILDDLCDSIMALYPDSVNNTCGFHIHTSFQPSVASFIASSEFFKYFKARWREWGNSVIKPKTVSGNDYSYFWDRLNGNNSYCRDIFDPHVQLIDHGGEKYRMLNFLPWQRIKTVECRLLPMFEDKTLTILATRELSDIYDTYLNENTEVVKLTEEVEERDGIQIIHKKEHLVPDIEYFEIQTEGRGVRDIPSGPDVYYTLGSDSQKYMAPFGKPYEEESE
jgi:hypothetical protein